MSGCDHGIECMCDECQEGCHHDRTCQVCGDPDCSHTCEAQETRLAAGL